MFYRSVSLSGDDDAYYVRRGGRLNISTKQGPSENLPCATMMCVCVDVYFSEKDSRALQIKRQCPPM